MYIILQYALPSLFLGLVIGYFLRRYVARLKVASAKETAEDILKEAQKEAEAKKREAILETKDQLIRERTNFERETRERRSELQRWEKRLLQKEDNLDKRMDVLDKKEKLVSNRERVVDSRETDLRKEQEEIRKELERISGLTADDAKNMLIRSMEDEARRDAQSTINTIENEAKATAEKKARDILAYTIQKLSSDITSEITVTSVSLPNDDMKGRIIGREGRNIRALETLTGVDIIIDDTPEAVVLSSFDPVRREIARVSMERLRRYRVRSTSASQRKGRRRFLISRFMVSLPKLSPISGVCITEPPMARTFSLTVKRSPTSPECSLRRSAPTSSSPREAGCSTTSEKP